LFTVAGYLLANPDWGPLSVVFEAPSIHVIAELTLALLLFADASRVSITAVKRDVRLPVRLLDLGLPLSVALGSLVAAWVGIQGHHDPHGGSALLEIAIGVAVGIALGLGSAVLLTLGSHLHWIVAGGRRLGALGAALSSFA
jgi:Kef-type K+ transport system membrane component KefB